jgi:hypothetical protein
MKRIDYLERMKAVERQYLVAARATSLLQQALQADPSLLSQERLSVADFRDLSENLEGTFLIRLFATFEAGLRDAWSNSFRQDTNPPMRDLLNGVAARRSIPPADLENAHAVRQFRNSLVHEGGEEADPIPLAVVRKYVCTFFKWLPDNW